MSLLSSRFQGKVELDYATWTQMPASSFKLLLFYTIRILQNQGYTYFRVMRM